MCYTAEAVDRLTQKSCNRLMNFCTGSIPWSKKSCPSQCSCKHPSTGDGNSLVLSFGKFGDNWKKIWRKYGENLWNILVLPSSCALVLNEKVSLEYNIFLTSTFYALQTCPAFICPIFWTPVCL